MCMSQTEKHETILQDSQQLPDETLQRAQQQNEKTTTFDNTSAIPNENTTDMHSVTVTTDSNIAKFPVGQMAENDTYLFHDVNAQLQNDTSTLNTKKIQILDNQKHFPNISKELMIHL